MKTIKKVKCVTDIRPQYLTFGKIYSILEKLYTTDKNGKPIDMFKINDDAGRDRWYCASWWFEPVYGNEEYE